MFTSVKSTIIGAAAIAVIGLMSTGGALAACVHTEWQNTMPGHALPTIIGRDCNGVLSISATASDGMGQTQDYGWVQAQQTGPDQFTAAFVGADATNNLTMQVHPSNQTMNVRIDTKFNTGTTTVWYAHFKLNSTY